MFQLRPTLQYFWLDCKISLLSPDLVYLVILLCDEGTAYNDRSCIDYSIQIMKYTWYPNVHRNTMVVYRYVCYYRSRSQDIHIRDQSIKSHYMNKQINKTEIKICGRRHRSCMRRVCRTLLACL